MRYLLLHAFPLDGSMWDQVGAALRAQGHEVIAPDLRGFGAAPLGDDDPDLERMVDDAIIALAGEPAIIAGCSLGGYVALGIARRRPDLVAALALVDTKATADADDARAQRERVAVLAEASDGGGSDAWSAGMIDKLLGITTRAKSPGVVARVESCIAAAPGPTVAWAQRAMARRPDARDALRAIAAPVLVIVGDEDTVSPMAEQELMLAVAPGATLCVIPGAGHLTPLEAPAAVAEALAALA